MVGNSIINLAVAMEYTTRFPEDLYPAENRSKYNHRVKAGYEKAKSLSIAIVGLAYNCEVYAAINLARVKTLGSMFKNHSIMVIENNSQDKTSDVLHGYCKSMSIRRPRFGQLDQLRFHYMAHMRNEYMRWLKTECPDYVLVLDFDVAGGFSYDGIMHSLSYEKQAIGSNGLIYVPERKFYDYISLIYTDKRKGDGDTRYDRGEDLVRVESVFGGACLYKYSSLSELLYSGYYDGCEHTSINRNLECFLNPSQIVLYSENPYTE